VLDLHVLDALPRAALVNNLPVLVQRKAGRIGADDHQPRVGFEQHDDGLPVHGVQFLRPRGGPGGKEQEDGEVCGHANLTKRTADLLLGGWKKRQSDSGDRNIAGTQVCRGTPERATRRRSSGKHVVAGGDVEEPKVAVRRRTGSKSSRGVGELYRCRQRLPVPQAHYPSGQDCRYRVHDGSAPKGKHLAGARKRNEGRLFRGSNGAQQDQEKKSVHRNKRCRLPKSPPGLRTGLVAARFGKWFRA
jgi:hypothetical protein